MGAAYFIVLESDIEGLDTGMDGKSLCRCIVSTDEAALQLGVRPLSEFFSIAPEEVMELMEGMDIDGRGFDVDMPPLQEFSALEGLTTIRALIANSTILKDGVLQDLRECDRILSAAAQHGVGWHFEIDF